MAIKGGDLIHVGNQILIDRAQTAGPGDVTINTDKIYELGNYYSVGQVRDIPDLSFSLESLDVSAEIEAMLTGVRFQDTDPVTGVPVPGTELADGTALRLSESKPLDVGSVFKPGVNATNKYDVIGSVAIPYLTLSEASYRFGLTDNASQTFTLKGDSVFYNPSNVYIEEFEGPFAGGDVLPDLAHRVHPYRGDAVANKAAQGAANGARYVLTVTAGSKRLSYGADFTEVADAADANNASKVTVTLGAGVSVKAGDKVRVIYASPDVDTFPQTVHAPASATRPAAIRGRNITVSVGGLTLNDRWTGIQSVNVDWRVDLQRDEEFGNSQAVAQDFDVPATTGSIEVKPRDYADLYNRVRLIAGVAENEVAGALTTKPLPLLVELHSPESGDVLKSLYVPDARFTFPGFSGQVQQKLTVTLNWESDSGELVIYKGEMPASARTMTDGDDKPRKRSHKKDDSDS